MKCTKIGEPSVLENKEPKGRRDLSHLNEKQHQMFQYQADSQLEEQRFSMMTSESSHQLDPVGILSF